MRTLGWFNVLGSIFGSVFLCTMGCSPGGLTAAGANPTPNGQGDSGLIVPNDGRIPQGQGDGNGGAQGFDASEPAGFFGASRCASSGLTFCEGFENGVDTAQWDNPNGLSTSSAQAARGTGALEVALGGSGKALIYLKSWPTGLNQHHFGRMFLWSETSLAPPDYSHVEFVQYNTAGGECYSGFPGGCTSYTFGTVGDLRFTQMPTDQFASQNSHPLPTGKWLCYEWEIDSAAATVAAWEDELPLITMQNLQTVDGDFSHLSIGEYAITSTSPATHIWIDEFAVNNSRIGCSL